MIIFLLSLLINLGIVSTPTTYSKTPTQQQHQIITEDYVTI